MLEYVLKKLDLIRNYIKDNPSLSETLFIDIDLVLGNILKKLDAATVDQPVVDIPDTIIRIWSDGACTGNPGPGGWGTIIEIGDQRFEYSGGSKRTTNNIMELTGALEGIKKTPEGSSIIVTSDSQYLIKGMTAWLKSWKAKAWKKADGKSVLNKDLWMELDAEAGKRSIEWEWIKGHAGHPENERCDQLARKAIPR